MASRYINPFTPNTQIGQGLQNIASMLFNGAATQRDNAARDAMNVAHSGLYEEQAKKASIERQLAERLLADQGQDAQDELIAASAGVPVHTVRGYRDALAGVVPMDPYNADPELSGRISRGMLAVRPTYADKTISAEQLAKAMNLHSERGDREAIMSGANQNPTRTSQAYFATSGKAPFGDLGGGAGSINLMTGENELNDLGAAKAGTERAQAGKYAAETRNLTNGLFGPQTFIEGADGTVTPHFLGQVAGKPVKAGARPVAPRQSGARSEISPTEALNVQKLIAYRLGIDPAELEQRVDPAVVGHLTARVSEYAQQTGNFPAAIERAIQETPLTEFSDPWFGSPKLRTFVTPPSAQQVQQSSPAMPSAGGGFASPSGKRYSAEDIEFTARKRGMTPQQVIQKMKLQPEA